MNQSLQNDMAIQPLGAAAGGTDPVTLVELIQVFRNRLALLLITPLVCGMIAFGTSYLITPIFTATSTFLPPQQQQSAAAAALASLGNIASIAGGATSAVRTPADQYVALMQSATVSDRIIDAFNLKELYGEHLRIDARRDLAKNVRFAIGKKDGLISIEVDDTSPQRAAQMANRYVEELRRLTSMLAMTEAQQRRLFFEHHLQSTQQKLTEAQQKLLASGVTESTLKAEPKAAAESYAKLRGEITAGEATLQALRGTLADSTPEVQRQQAALSVLRGQLARIERDSNVRDDPDYVSRYREYKYQETLFELFARQYELARLDESREGAVIQVIDPATPPERKSRPHRSLIALLAWLAATAVIAASLATHHVWRRTAQTLAPLPGSGSEVN